MSCVFFGGDWNSHIGRDGIENRFAMVRGSSAGGKQMLKWLQKEVAQQFAVADHRIPAKFRGTWGSHQRGEWYELDFFVVSKAYAGRFGCLKTWSVGESDHAARSLSLRIATTPKSKPNKNINETVRNTKTTQSEMSTSRALFLI